MRTTAAITAFIVAALVGSVYADVSWTAQVTISGDTTAPGSIVKGTMRYYFNTTADSSHHFLRTDYTSPVSMVEIINYATAIKYKYCGTACFAETYKVAADEIYFKASVDNLNGEDYTRSDSTVCKGYTRSDGTTVKKIWTKSGDTSVLCKAIITNDAGASKTITFDTFSSGVTFSKFTEYTGWNCPAPVCRRVMDVVLVMDESGSIDTSTEWPSMVNFATKLVDAFDVSMDSVTMGVVFFSTRGRLIISLSSSPQSIKNAISTSKAGGSTCIGCGLSIAVNNVLPKKLDGRPKNVSELIILLTDGQNNEPTVCTGSRSTRVCTDTPARNLTNSTKLIRKRGAIAVAIGVGSGYNLTELTKIATPVVGVQTVIEVANFAALPTIVSNLVANTCTDLGAQPCGDQCYGFCSCNQTCVCPVCEPINVCYNNTCTLTSGGNSYGCVAKALSCDDSNKCTNDFCDNSTGCYHTNVTCDDHNPCTDNLCKKDSGCYYPKTSSCDLGDPCYSYSCDNATGCQKHYLCDDDPCRPGTCSSTGCSFSNAVCDDGNACTVDTCVQTGGAHCVHTTINPETDCTDGMFCTEDTCNNNTGCKNIPYDCNVGKICADELCSESQDQCVNDTTADCSGCALHPLVCTTDEPCKVAKCSSLPPTHPGGDPGSECIVVNKTCISTDLCSIDFCNISTNQCDSTPKTCAKGKNCTVGVCNPADGSCTVQDKNCTGTDPCWIDYCDEATDSCKRRSFCEAHNCEVATCTPSADGLSATCTYAPLDCSSGSLCLNGFCDNSTGECVLTEVKCSDGLICTSDDCDREKGCVFTNLTCDDDDPCTLDFCNETIGCYHEPKCVDGLFCTEDVCQLDGTCVFQALECNLDLSGESNACFVENCTEARHCFKQTANTAFLDVCGNCIRTYGMNESVWNSSYIRTACVSGMTWPEFVATLTAAAIAGIIIAAIIVGIIMAISGFFGTKELIRRAKQAQNQAAHNNPLYQDTGREMMNPAFAGKD